MKHLKIILFNNLKRGCQNEIYIYIFFSDIASHDVAKKMQFLHVLRGGCLRSNTKHGNSDENLYTLKHSTK